MGNYLKKFETNQERTTFESSVEYIEPYVSLVNDDFSVHYNKPYLCKLTLNDNSVVKLYGEGELTSTMTSSYKSIIVSAEIGDLCTGIGDEAFCDCSHLTSVTIGNGVTSIGRQAFRDCSHLTSVTIGNGVTSIGRQAFYNCAQLTSVTIPNSVTSIGNGAFYWCTHLTSVTIGNGVTSIGQSAFYSCLLLTSVTVKATTPPTLSSDSFKSTNNCPIYVPSSSVDIYKSAANWSTYASRIQAMQ